MVLYGDASSRTAAEVRIMKDLLSVQDRSLLELGCGTGRITFAIAPEVRELVAIDIDSIAIEQAQQRNVYANVTFLVENMEEFDLGREFDVVLSVDVGYMYLRDVRRAITNIANHLQKDGVALLLCSSPEDEYQRIVDLLVEENIKTVSFYNEFEGHLAHHFAFEKHTLQEHIRFSDLKEILDCFQRELEGEYAKEMNDQHIRLLATYFHDKEPLTVGIRYQVYVCTNE